MMYLFLLHTNIWNLHAWTLTKYDNNWVNNNLCLFIIMISILVLLKFANSEDATGCVLFMALFLYDAILTKHYFQLNESTLQVHKETYIGIFFEVTVP